MVVESTPVSIRKDKERQFQRSLIMGIAEQLFSERGYSATTMEEIAKDAGFAVGSLYKFFKSKQDLYAAMLRSKVDVIEPKVSHAIQSAETPTAKLEAYFRARLQMFWDHPRFFKVYYRDLANAFGDLNAGLTPEISSRYEEHLRGIKAIFSDGVKSGLFKDISPTTLTMLSEGVIRSYTASLSLQKVPVRNESEERKIFEFFLSGVTLNERVQD